MQHPAVSPKSFSAGRSGSIDVRWLVTMIGLVTAGLAATVVVGRITLLDPVKDVDEKAFETLVDGLQAIPGLVELSEFATDLGAVPVNYGMVIGAAAFVALARRRFDVAGLMILALVGAHGFQYLTNVLVDGSTPEGSRVVGTAGPYFSGGVMRVVLITGMIASVAFGVPGSRRQDRAVWRLALLLGALEAITRLSLGRHWPLDILAAFPIGLGILWVFRSALGRLPSRTGRPAVY